MEQGDYTVGAAGTGTLPFQAVQLDFAAYIRHPEKNPIPAGIEERRMRIYARLFYNNIESFLAKTFGVFREIAGDAQWHAMIRDFFHRHRAQSPYYSQVPEEFMEYLNAYRAEAGAGSVGESAGQSAMKPTPESSPALLPFALELCHYEWVRFALDLAPDAEGVFDDDPIGIDDDLRVSPLAWPLRYAYPVQRIRPDYQPMEPADEPTWLIACRNRHDRVRFTKSNALTTRLLKLIEENDNRGALKMLAQEIDAPAERIEHTGLETLNRLHRQDIVVRPRERPRETQRNHC